MNDTVAIEPWFYLIKGMLLSGGLIVAIGSQNAFVLRQGLRRQFVFPVVLVCSLFDALFMSLGILGVGKWLATNQWVANLLALSGAVFLFLYGLLAFRSAWRGGAQLKANSDPSERGLSAVLSITLAVTLLNPHVYLDTLVIVGGVASSLPNQAHGWFLLGSVLASFGWFFGLGYGAQWLTPWFAKPSTWRLLEVAIGLVMLSIAWDLALFWWHAR